MEENSEVKKFPGVRELEAYLATLPSSELIYIFNKKVEVEFNTPLSPTTGVGC